MRDPVVVDMKKLVSCQLICAACTGRPTVYNWTTASGSSTSNQLNHLRKDHGAIFEKAERAQKVSQGLDSDSPATSMQQTLKGAWLSSQVSYALSTRSCSDFDFH
jgi:hypothetical protein